MDQDEIRYWVRKLPVLKHPKAEIVEKVLKEEIPFFLHYLIERPYSTAPVTRMWFTPEQIATSALLKAKRYNRNKLEAEMSQILLSILDASESIRDVCFCVSDMQDWLLRKGLRGHDSTSIRKVLQDKWKLQQSVNSNSYLQYRITGDGTINGFMQKGRFYKLSHKQVLKLNYLDDFDDKDVST